jgi:hypothetical protein
MGCGKSPLAAGPHVHKIWCMSVSPNVLVVPSLHSLFSNHPHNTSTRPCRMSSKSQKMGARAMGCGNCPQATRPHVHKIWWMGVSPNVLVVPSFHGLFSNHPHNTCARPCRTPSKSQKMGARARGCEKCPQAARPLVHKNVVHVCLPKCFCSAFIPWSLLQPPSAPMFKTVQSAIKSQKMWAWELVIESCCDMGGEFSQYFPNAPRPHLHDSL